METLMRFSMECRSFIRLELSIRWFEQQKYSNSTELMRNSCCLAFDWSLSRAVIHEDSANDAQ